jgi:hypothetical protein
VADDVDVLEEEVATEVELPPTELFGVDELLTLPEQAPNKAAVAIKAIHDLFFIYFSFLFI